MQLYIITYIVRRTKINNQIIQFRYSALLYVEYNLLMFILETVLIEKSNCSISANCAIIMFT